MNGFTSRRALARCAAAAPAAALLLLSTAQAGAADRVYGGSTRAQEPIVVQTSANGAKLKSMVIAWEARCGDGEYFVDTGRRPVERLTVGFDQPGPNSLVMSRNANGRFRGVQVAARDLGDGLVARFETTVTGTVGRSSAKGTLSAEVKIFSAADGSQRDTCRTGSLSWGASRRPGVIFGGATSQQEPVVVRLDAARRRVATFLFGWDSQRCEPPGGFRIGDALTNFRISGGRFGDSFEQRFPITGGERRFTYDVRGRVQRTRASGTFSVGLSETGPDGQATCQTGRVTWSAATG